MNLSARWIALTVLGVTVCTNDSWAQEVEPGLAPYTELKEMASGMPVAFSTVPAGKRLVLKYVNCSGTSTTYKDSAFLYMNNPNNINSNTIVLNFLMIPSVSTNGELANYAINSGVLAYFDPGQAPGVAILLPSSASGQLNLICALTGYYVTLP